MTKSLWDLAAHLKLSVFNDLSISINSVIILLATKSVTIMGNQLRETQYYTVCIILSTILIPF